MSKKRGLGRGLSALIPEDAKDDIREQLLTDSNTCGKILNIKIQDIKANKQQPRKEFDLEALEALSDSIKLHGILQPIIVRPQGDNYEIVAGERRFRAAQLATLNEVPCIVRDLEDQLTAQLALVENIQREDLNQIEEAMAFDELLVEYSLTQSQLSDAIGKSRTYIANTLRLLKLQPSIIDMIRNQEITSGHGRALLIIDDPKEQVAISEIIYRKNLSVRETEDMVKKIKERQDKGLIQKQILKRRDPHLKHFEEELMSYFGTKVRVKDKKGKGKIEIEYYDIDDLDRILELLEKDK